MLVSKSQVAQAINSHKVLFVGLFIVSIVGLKDRMVGFSLNSEGLIHLAVEFCKISFCFTFTCTVIVLITLFFRFIMQKRTKEA